MKKRFYAWRKTVFDDEMTYYVEPTQVGLVIDVNQAETNDQCLGSPTTAVSFISDLLIRMNAGGLILSTYRQREQENPMNLKRKTLGSHMLPCLKWNIGDYKKKKRHEHV